MEIEWKYGIEFETLVQVGNKIDRLDADPAAALAAAPAADLLEVDESENTQPMEVDEITTLNNETPVSNEYITGLLHHLYQPKYYKAREKGFLNCII